MPAPFEIIAAPFTLWTAPAIEAFPLIDAAPAGNWNKVGSSGDLNYSEEGVQVTHTQEIDTATPLGSTGPIKAFRTSESFVIALTLWDLTLEEYNLALNGNAVTDTAASSGVAGIREANIYQGGDVTRLSLLLRSTGISPYGDAAGAWNMQYQVPIAFQKGSPSPIFVKGSPAGLALEFEALIDPAAAVGARFGKIIAQDEDPA